jgi:anti-sigma factor RsiW
MNADIHERALRLIDAWHVEGIPMTDREWLEAHLASCVACAARAVATEQAIQTVRRNTFAVDPALVSTTQARVRRKARAMREDHIRMRALWISCALSWILGALTAPLLWQGIAWVGRRLELSQSIWVMAFTLCWISPASLVAAFAAWKYSDTSEAARTRRR